MTLDEQKDKELLGIIQDMLKTNQSAEAIIDEMGVMLKEVAAQRDAAEADYDLLVRFLQELHKIASQPQGEKDVLLTLQGFLKINNLTLM